MGAKQTVLRYCQISPIIFQRMFNLEPCPVCMVEAGKAMELFGCGTNHELTAKPKDSHKSYMFNARIGGDWAKDICWSRVDIKIQIYCTCQHDSHWWSFLPHGYCRWLVQHPQEESFGLDMQMQMHTHIATVAMAMQACLVWFLLVGVQGEDMILQCITTFRRFGTNANAGLTNTKVDQCSLSIAICGAKLKPGKTAGRESLTIYRAQTTANKEWSYWKFQINWNNLRSFKRIIVISSQKHQ